MDFSALEYAYGDDLLRPLDYHPDWDAEAEPTETVSDGGASGLHRATSLRRPFPVVYVVSDLNREGITSLITQEVFNLESRDVLFESVAAATAHMPIAWGNRSRDVHDSLNWPEYWKAFKTFKLRPQ